MGKLNISVLCPQNRKKILWRFIFTFSHAATVIFPHWKTSVTLSPFSLYEIFISSRRHFEYREDPGYEAAARFECSRLQSSVILLADEDLCQASQALENKTIYLFECARNGSLWEENALKNSQTLKVKLAVAKSITAEKGETMKFKYFPKHCFLVWWPGN